MALPDPRLTAFAYRRQRLDGSAPDALAAVEAAVGVYAANPSGPLSILARAPSATAADVLALERDGRVVRGRAMRTSAFVLPAAIAPSSIAATAQPIERFAWMLRAARVAPEGFEAARAAVLAAADEPRTARELRAAAGLDDVDVGPLVSYLALRGDLVTLGAASVTSNVSRYQAREACGGAPPAGAGAGRPGPVPGAEAARAWLAGAYLRAFGPARVEDLAWWAGFPRSAAAAALAAHETVDAGDGLPAPGRRTWPRTRRASRSPTSSRSCRSGTPGRWATRSTAAPGSSIATSTTGCSTATATAWVRCSSRAGRSGAWGHRGSSGRDGGGSGPLRAADAAAAGGDRGAPRVHRRRSSGYRELRVRDVPTVVPDRPRVRRPLA